MTATSERENKVAQIGALLTKKNHTVTCAESCTGGGVAHAFTAVAGSSNWFELGWVTYSNQAKHQCLGVPLTTLDRFGAVSEQTVAAMAKGAATHANANYAVAISGIAGPGGGSAEKPVGLVWFGVWAHGAVDSESIVFSGDREQVREQAIDYALNLLHQRLVASEG